MGRRSNQGSAGYRDYSWLKKGADLKAIHTAVEKGNEAKVRKLLERDPQQAHALLDSETPDQPLHLAAWQNHPAIASILISYGADVNARGDQGQTPLHYAARHSGLFADWS